MIDEVSPVDDRLDIVVWNDGDDIVRHEVETHGEERDQTGDQPQHHRVLLAPQRITDTVATIMLPPLPGVRLHPDTHVGLGVVLWAGPDHVDGLLGDND